MRRLFLLTFATLLVHGAVACAGSGSSPGAGEPVVGPGGHPDSDPGVAAPRRAADEGTRDSRLRENVPESEPGDRGPASAVPASSLPDPLAAGWKGASVCELLSQTDRLRALRCTFPPGVGHERHVHVPHFGYALTSGRMRITDDRGTRDLELAAGSSFTSEGGAHEVVNVGTTTVVYLIVEPR